MRHLLNKYQKVFLKALKITGWHYLATILRTKMFLVLKVMNSGGKLNFFLKEVLGWKTQDNMDEIVYWGKNGMDGVLEFTRYFVEKHGVSEGLFKGKLSGLLDALEKM
jgi:hypothetical protein